MAKPLYIKKPTYGYRVGTSHEMVTVNFTLTGGGLGDYINFSAALLFIAKQMPFVKGHVIVSKPFYYVAEFLFRPFMNWKVTDSNSIAVKLDEGSLIVLPEKKSQLLNATGAHLLDLGFNYYCQMDEAPEGHGFLPEIRYGESSTWRWNMAMEKDRYAVITTGATTKARSMPGWATNEIVNYTLSLGLTPVFLGKADFAEGKPKGSGYEARFDETIDFTKGIDLREQTTLLEATQIMAHAKFVLGLDNGLLHFAGTTETPIIFGHNIALVKHREIRRRKGVTVNIAVDEKDLGCIGCQSRMRFQHGHSFTKCIYDDYACVDLLFSKNCEAWKTAIDKVLSI